MKPQYVSPVAASSGCLAQTKQTVQGCNDSCPEYSPDFNDLGHELSEPKMASLY